MVKKETILCVLLIPVLMLATTGFCGDLDDGISTYTEDNIQKSDDLGRVDRNITFIKMDAKSKAKVRAKSGSEDGATSSSGSGNMNSVVLGAGSNIKGDIIIIDESKGDKFQIIE